MESRIVVDETHLLAEEQVRSRYLRMITTLGSICDQLGVPWFVSDGTLIGAVRHSGFIPWDDDVDISIAGRDAFYTLSEHAADFTYPYVFVNREIEHEQLKHISRDHPDFVGIHGGIPRVYDVSTTCTIGRIVFPGMFIDVFPFFECPSCGTGIMRRAAANAREFPSEQLLNTELHAFEDISVRIPKAYDSILTAVYGDWRTPKKYSHGSKVWDIPYRERSRFLFPCQLDKK